MTDAEVSTAAPSNEGDRSRLRKKQLLQKHKARVENLQKKTQQETPKYDEPTSAPPPQPEQKTEEPQRGKNRRRKQILSRKYNRYKVASKRNAANQEEQQSRQLSHDSDELGSGSSDESDDDCRVQNTTSPPSSWEEQESSQGGELDVPSSDDPIEDNDKGDSTETSASVEVVVGKGQDYLSPPLSEDTRGDKIVSKDIESGESPSSDQIERCPLSPQKHTINESVADNDFALVAEEPKDDSRSPENNKSEDANSLGWDTRSVQDHPPEGASPLDPSWDTSRVPLFSSSNSMKEDTPADGCGTLWNTFDIDDFDAKMWQMNSLSPGKLEILDSESWDDPFTMAKKDCGENVTKAVVPSVEGNKVEAASDVQADGVVSVSTVSSFKIAGREDIAIEPRLLEPTGADSAGASGSSPNNVIDSERGSQGHSEDADASKSQDVSGLLRTFNNTTTSLLDDDTCDSANISGFETSTAETSLVGTTAADAALEEAVLLMKQSQSGGLMTLDVDVDEIEKVTFTDTAFESHAALKDDEALLSSPERSDAIDGGADATDTASLMKQVEKEKRIEQYKERDEDDPSDTEEEKDDEEDSEASDAEVHYISADSDEEEEMAALVVAESAPSPFTVPGIVVGSVPAEQVANFNPAASAEIVARLADIRKTPPSPQNARFREKVGFFHFLDSKRSTSSDKDDSAMDASAAASSLRGEGALGLTGSSVASEMAHALSLPPPPPPPPRRSKKKRSAKHKPLMKIPPPPPEKLKKWEDEKMRPIKHLQDVANAKATADPVLCGTDQTQLESSAVRSRDDSEGAADLESAASFVTTFSTSRDEIEAAVPKDSSGKRTKMKAQFYQEETKNAVITMQDDLIMGFCAVGEASPISLRRLNISSPRARNEVSFVMSPPHVSRTELGDTSLLSSEANGVWTAGDASYECSPSAFEKVLAPSSNNTADETPPPTLKTGIAPIADIKMAERLALASSAAARKFAEDFPDVAGEDTQDSPPSVNSHSQKPPYGYDEVVDPEKPLTSCFCAPGMLDQSAYKPGKDGSSGEDLLQQVSDHVKEWALLDPKMENQAKRGVSRAGPELGDSSFDDTHHAGLELVGGAFSTWQDSDYVGPTVAKAASMESSRSQDPPEGHTGRSEPIGFVDLLSWLEKDVLALSPETRFEKVDHNKCNEVNLAARTLLSLLGVDKNLNALCRHAAHNFVMRQDANHRSIPSSDNARVLDVSSESFDVDKQRPKVYPFSIPVGVSKRPRSSILAANFVSFLNRLALLSGVQSPFRDQNPFLFGIVSVSLSSPEKTNAERKLDESSMQDLVFQHDLGEVTGIVRFFFQACGAQKQGSMEASVTSQETNKIGLDTAASNFPLSDTPQSLLYNVPTESPRPFETAVWNMPSIVAIMLGFLGDPVAVCRMKMANRFCRRLIHENEHHIMRDAVRLGGIGMHIRPSFWMWITLEKCGRSLAQERPGPSTVESGQNRTVARAAEPGAEVDDEASGPIEYQSKCITVLLPELEKRGREGKWHHVIQRDVSRAFGNMPPHKTGARLRTDSIVRALVTWGRGRLLKRGVKGGGVSSPTPTIGADSRSKPKPRQATGPPPWERGDGVDADSYQGPTEVVSQWSGISPVPSFSSQHSGKAEMEAGGSLSAKAVLASSVAKALGREHKSIKHSRAIAIEELALSGNTLTNEMKLGLQNQLGYILHALAAAHEDVGYCQGMDYIVAHLLRVLQDTVRWHSVRGTLSPVIGAQPEIPVADSDEQSLSTQIDQAIDSSLVVEETVFRVMDTFMTTYNLRHMYWPELRCLKTCCRVFERLIQMKLPVLADHFAYHDLNVGLFALGWFQTLFLYLPSMPSATVCHMWDIWLVERSFKIFFRVGTAILFLSQPILLNHELEGMMTYLNTFPDATLLNPDILIACALQIKVTNRMLVEIEREVTLYEC